MFSDHPKKYKIQRLLRLGAGAVGALNVEVIRESVLGV